MLLWRNRMLNQISVPCLDSHHHNAKQMFEFRLGWQFLVEILACRFQALGISLSCNSWINTKWLWRSNKNCENCANSSNASSACTWLHTSKYTNKVQENHEIFAIVCLVPKRLEESSSSAPGSWKLSSAKMGKALQNCASLSCAIHLVTSNDLKQPADASSEGGSRHLRIFTTKCLIQVHWSNTFANDLEFSRRNVLGALFGTLGDEP